MEKLGITLDTGETSPQINQRTEDPDITTLKRRFRKSLMRTTVNRIEVKIQLKDDANLIQQKGRPIPIHLQQSVGKEMIKIMKQGHIEKVNNIDENCFFSPAVITVKKGLVGKDCIRFAKAQRNYHKKKVPNAVMEEVIS